MTTLNKFSSYEIVLERPPLARIAPTVVTVRFTAKEFDLAF